MWHWPTLDVRLGRVRGAGPRLRGAWLCRYRRVAGDDIRTFSKLPFAVGIAYLAFGEVIDAWTWTGAVIIFASAVYITRREAQLRAERAAATRDR